MSVQRELGPGHRVGLSNTTAVFSAFLHKEMDSDDAGTLTVSKPESKHFRASGRHTLFFHFTSV